MDKYSGKNKRERRDEEADIGSQAKKIKIEMHKKRFHEQHGESYWVYIYKNNMEKISQEKMKSLRERLLDYQVENPNLSVEITRVKESMAEKALKIRVHSEADRITVDEIVKKCTLSIYTTYCFKDINNDQDKQIMKLYLERNFPEKYLTIKHLPSLLTASMGKYLKGEEEVQINVILPPTNHHWMADTQSSLDWTLKHSTSS